MKRQTVYVETLGCPKNITRTQDFLRTLDFDKYEVVYSPEEADIIVLNTCGFITDAVRESVERALELRTVYPDKRVVFAGCVPLRYGKHEVLAELNEVDDVALGMIIPTMKGGNRSTNDSPVLTYPYAYVSLGEGCNGTCSYCAIPRLWGKFTSRSVSDIVDELNQLSEAGIKEAILVSQDSGAWGIDLYGHPSLSELIGALKDVAIPWIRILYLNPAYVNDRLLKRWSDVPNLLPYFDIPLQSGSDRILQLMRRGYNRQQVLNAVRLIDQAFPDAVKRTSIIVGFPTETYEDLLQTQDLLEQVDFAHIGLFMYSDEEGTDSHALRPKVPKTIARRWLGELQKLALRFDTEWRNNLVGSRQQCLVEGASEEHFMGRVAGDAPEIDGVFVGTGQTDPGELVNVFIERAEPGKLVGHKES